MKQSLSIIFLIMVLLSGCETTPSQNNNDMRVGGRASGSNDYVGGKLGVGSKF